MRYNLWATNYLILCIYRRSEEKWKSFSPNPVDNLIIFIMVNHVGNGWFEKKLFRAQRTDDLIIIILDHGHNLWLMPSGEPCLVLFLSINHALSKHGQSHELVQVVDEHIILQQIIKTRSIY